MLTSESHIPVLLKFRAMASPITVTVPGHVLRYLDAHAERIVGPNGVIVYGQPSIATPVPDWRDAAAGTICQTA